MLVKCQLLEVDATPHTYLMPIQGYEDRTIIVSLKIFLFYYLKSSLLEFNCFTMLCWFLQYNKVNQLSVQSLSRVQLFATPWTAVHQASLSFTISQGLLKLVSIESVTLSNHLLLCPPLLLLPSIFPSIRVFSNESALRIRWLNY